MFFKKKIEDKEVLKAIFIEAWKAQTPFVKNLLTDKRAKESDLEALMREAQILFWALPAIIVTISKFPDISKEYIVKSTRQKTIYLLRRNSKLDPSSILDARFHIYLEQFFINDDLRSVLFAFHSYTGFIEKGFDYDSDSLSLSAIQDAVRNIIQVVEAAKKYKITRSTSIMSEDDWKEITTSASTIIYDSTHSILPRNER